MANFITLTCPSCGSKLKITEDMERFACISCGNEHLVLRGEGTISLQPVVEGIAKVQVGVDKTASELAIARLSKEIYEIEETIKAAQASEDNPMMAHVVAIIILIIISIALFISGISSILEGENISVFKTIILPALFTGIAIAISRILVAREKEHNKKLKQFRIQIAQKRKELERHEKIVSG